MTKKCGPCGGNDPVPQDQGKKPCQQTEKKSGFSKTPCKQEKKGKCHSSHEKFKENNKCSDKFSSTEKTSCENGNRHGQGSCKKDKSPTVCDDCPKPLENRACETKEDSVSTSSNNCSSAINNIVDKDKNQIPCTSREKSTCTSEEPPCSHAFKDEAQESSCNNKSSIYSSMASNCLNMAKDFVKLKPSKPKCPSENFLKSPLCKEKELLHTSTPCPPKAEKASVKSEVSKCAGGKTTPGPCANKDEASINELFPMDARNEKLNACIKKYMQKDPGQVVNKCSKYVDCKKAVSDDCIKKVQQKCLGTMPTSMKKARFQQGALLPAKYRTLMGRWAPSATIYLAATALVSVYVTEWKPVLRYFPGYGDYVKQLEESQNK